jgi:hypothetical protein
MGSIWASGSNLETFQQGLKFGNGNEITTVNGVPEFNGANMLDGSYDIYYQENFSVTRSADLASGNSATPFGGGALAGALTDNLVTPISGVSTLVYTQAAGSLNDYFFLPNKTIELKQAGNWSGLVSYITYSGDVSDLKAIVWDVTNGAQLTTDLDLIPVAGNPTRFILGNGFYIPSGVTEIAVGFQVVVENIGAVFEVDDIELSTDPFRNGSTIYSNGVSLSGNSGEAVLAGNPIVFNGTGSGWNESTYKYTVQRDNSALNISTGVDATSANFELNVYINDTEAYVITRNTAATSTAQGSIAIPKGKVSAGDTISIRSKDDSLTIENNPEQHYLNINETAQDSAVITPATSNLTGWNEYTPTFTGFTTAVTNQSIRWKQVGEDIYIRGYGVAGTLGGAIFSVSLPSGLEIDTDKVSPIANTQNAGEFIRFNNGSTGANMQYIAFVDPATANNLFYVTNVLNSDTVYKKEVPSSIIQTGDAFFLDFTVPIKGWSAEAQFLAAIPSSKIAYIKDVKASGVAGGSFSSGAYRTRDLTEISGPNPEIVSLSSNQFTLKKGSYTLSGGSVANAVDQNRVKIVNVTDSEDVILSSSRRASSGNLGNTETTFSGHVQLAKDTTFEVQHRCQTTNSSGFGLAAGFGEDEIYTTVKIEGAITNKH